MKKPVLLPLIAITILLISSCNKQGFTDSAAATLSLSDTIRFDTLFTSTGSVTKHYTIINTNDQKLTLQSIRLAGGTSSPYTINVDGVSANAVENIVLDAGDSIYVFVSVTIDPSDETTPFLIKDSIEVSFNGNRLYTHLEAYGQNAHFLQHPVITTDTTWYNDLPYVVSGSLHIAANATLTIAEGCRIYMHANAPVLVDGSLAVNGTDSNNVSFQGDRLDRGYRDLPAAWPGIFFNESSHNNHITFCTIKNAYQAITATGASPDDAPKLRLTQCIVDNIYDTGIRAVASSIEAVNCLITNCGANVFLAGGGRYNFTHCTISSTNTRYLNHTRSVVYISDSHEQFTGNTTHAVFRNCIIWGNGGMVTNEIVTEKKGNSTFDILLDHTLYGHQQQTPMAEETNTIININPAFDSIDASGNIFNFRLQPVSPAIGSGTATATTIDLENKPRSGKPDLGCYNSTL